MEWSKWDYETVVEKIPFMPLMLLVEAIAEERTEDSGGEVVLNNPNWYMGVLSQEE